ncbi:hypothetical protein ACQUYK_24935, partial [Bacillus cereus]|uniref:hypothetical protein n=1 Tax=Bacillus cereus TaxID=1396 RepID=UPI003D16DD1F
WWRAIFLKLYYFMLFLFAKIKMITECWEPLKGFPTLCKNFTFKRKVFYFIPLFAGQPDW